MIEEHEMTAESLVVSNTPIIDDIVALAPKKARKVRKAKVKLKERTLEEFKNWLEGLEEFQDSDWIPNAEQWSTIRSSITLIKEEEYYDEPTGYQPPQSAPVAQHQTPHNQQIVNSVPAPIQSEPLSASQIENMVQQAKASSGMGDAVPAKTGASNGTGDEFV